MAAIGQAYDLKQAPAHLVHDRRKRTGDLKPPHEEHEDDEFPHPSDDDEGRVEEEEALPSTCL